MCVIGACTQFCQRAVFVQTLLSSSSVQCLFKTSVRDWHVSYSCCIHASDIAPLALAHRIVCNLHCGSIMFQLLEMTDSCKLCRGAHCVAVDFSACVLCGGCMRLCSAIARLLSHNHCMRFVILISWQRTSTPVLNTPLLPLRPVLKTVCPENSTHAVLACPTSERQLGLHHQAERPPVTAGAAPYSGRRSRHISTPEYCDAV